MNTARQVFERILVICTGNICRSPMAAYLFRRHLGDRNVTVASAGIAALAGQGIDLLAGVVLAAHGIDGSAHRARQLTREQLQESDLVLTMERSQLAHVRGMVPEATGKLFLLDKWAGSRDIPDPYRRRRGVFEHVYAMIDEGVHGWLPYLQ